MVRRFEHPVFALQYDLSEGDRSRLGDREWYAERLADTRGPILELGAGTGRITLPLAQAGHDVVAVDSARAMLQRLTHRLAEPPAGTIRPVCADMRRLPLRGAAVAAAFCGYNSLGCLLEPEDLARTYAEVHRLLDPGAPFLFDVPVPGSAEPYEPSGPPWEERWEQPDGDVRTITRSATILTPPEAGRIRLDYAFRWRDASGAEDSETVRFELNTWPPAFYVEQAEAAGFAVVRTDVPTFLDRRGRERAWAFVELRRGRD
jgi:SAM-dependent methyltransferase